MKKRILISLGSLLAVAAAAGTYVAQTAADPIPACCAPGSASAVPAAAVVPLPGPSQEHNLPARSIYQLDRSWTNDSGQTIQLRSLAGQPVVLAMFFSNCQLACPMMVADLKRLRELLPENVRAQTRFVLVSFDPLRDTPTVLHAYREKMDLDAGWTLLRGDDNSVRELAMLLGVKYKQDANGQFSHSNLFTVLSRGGVIVHQRSGLGGDISEAAAAVKDLVQ